MSLTYLYNKLENMNSQEQFAYIQNIFLRFQIRPKVDIDKVFVDTDGKETSGKNPLGYLVMHLNPDQLQELIPEYLRQLVDRDTFDSENQLAILNTVDTVMQCIDEGCIPDVEDCLSHKYIKSYNFAEMLDVFEFGVGKYSEWSFLELNPYLLVPALFRHLYKFSFIRLSDEESGKSHLTHALCNIRMIQLILQKFGTCNFDCDNCNAIGCKNYKELKRGT